MADDSTSESASRRGVVIFVSIVTAVVVGTAMYAAIRVAPWDTTPPEHSARYYPPDVVAYLWLTLSPSGNQRTYMTETWEQFDQMPGFGRWLDRVEEQINRETRIDVSQVGDWFGGEVSAALFDVDADGGRVEGAITVAVRDRVAAAGFLEEWLEYLRAEHSTSFVREAVNGYEAWVGEDGEQFYALTEDLLVAASTRRSLEQVLERASGDHPRTLDSDADFARARAALPDRRFASFYIDYGRVVDIIGNGWGGDVCGGGLFETPDRVMGSAGWVDRGLVVEVMTPTVIDWWVDPTDLGESADLLPADSLGFLAATFDPDVDNLRDSLSRCSVADLVRGRNDRSGWFDLWSADDAPEPGTGASLADLLNLGLWAVEQMVGFDPEEDLLDHLQGDVVVAVHDVDLDSDLSGNPVDGVAILSYRPGREEELAATVGSLFESVLSPTGESPERIEVGADNDAHILRQTGWSLSPGYVLHDGYLTLATSEKALEISVTLQERRGDRLSDTGEYRRTVGHLPGSLFFLAYVDFQRVIDELNPAHLDQDLRDVLSEGLSAVAVGSTTDNGYTRVSVVLTLLPDR